MSAAPGQGRGARGLARAVLARALWFLATLALAATLLQGLLWAAPGDPIDLIPNGEELRPALSAAWGLDQPIPVRLARALGRAAVGDLGVSLSVKPGAAVAGLVWEAAKTSARLVSGAFFLSVALAFGLAWRTAGRPGFARGLVNALSVAPAFLLAWLLVTSLNEGTFALMNRGLIGRPDWFALPDQPSALRALLAVVVLATGSGALGQLHAACEDEIVRVRDAPYVEGALALGLPAWPHVLTNLAPALATVAASRVAGLLGGLVVVEKVLLLRGAGALLWEAALRRDYPLALGIGLFAAAGVAGARFLAEAVTVALDRRAREAL